ncbi:MAG TPA: hypothetical protein VFN13_09370 [Rudaea sp.]|nr:hypothetical protein [Rudaea sp.]
MKPIKSTFVAICVSLVFAAASGSAFAKRLTLHDAIVKVEHDTHGKVLSAETKHSGKRTIYRIKVLTKDGQVRVIEVPAENNK